MGRFKFFMFVIALAGLLVAGRGAFIAGPEPVVEVNTSIESLGRSSSIPMRVVEVKRGLSEIRVELVQGDNVALLHEETHVPIEPWTFWGERTTEANFIVEVGREHQEWLKEGDAALRISAGRAPAWLRQPDPAMLERSFRVKLRPPQLQVLSSGTYVTQGGSEAVVYRVGDDAVRDGVESGGYFFPGYKLPGSDDDNERFALFAAHYDDSDGSGIRLIAEDEVGNRSSLGFVDQYKPSPGRNSVIRVSKEFIEEKVVPILDQTPELDATLNATENFLMVNNELRKLNAQRLRELSANTTRAFLWDGSFLRMKNAARTANFNDRRRYAMNSRVIDQQIHLGLDLASTKQAPIQAAQHGKVMLAEFLGIYGNTVVLDHGFGLQSVYAHLSRIDVQVGDDIENGAEIGRSGATGMAGGDHLHFTVLLHGTPVNPAEWFDADWIRNRIVAKLGDAYLEAPAEGS